MNSTDKASSNWEKGMKKSTKQVFFWTILWTTSIALLTFGPKFFWDYQTLPTYLSLMLNAALGVAMVWANVQHLRCMDEMQQKVFMDAAVLTLGVGLIFSGSYQVWQDIGIMSSAPEIAYVMIVMALTFMAKMILGMWRTQ